jgi:hypothetical protein
MGLVSGLAVDSLSFLLLLWGVPSFAVIYVTYYVIYQRYFHPLSRFPGPFLASLTDLWQVYQFLSLKQPYNLTDLHAQHGEFVRYGPDKLSVTCEDAITPLYQKGGKSFPKTEFYDAYGATHPNVFGMRDEEVAFAFHATSCKPLLTLVVVGSLDSAAPYVAQLFDYIG